MGWNNGNGFMDSLILVISEIRRRESLFKETNRVLR
jgi:hypothetical protein